MNVNSKVLLKFDYFSVIHWYYVPLKNRGRGHITVIYDTKKSQISYIQMYAFTFDTVCQETGVIILSSALNQSP